MQWKPNAECKSYKKMDKNGYIYVEMERDIKNGFLTNISEDLHESSAFALKHRFGCSMNNEIFPPIKLKIGCQKRGESAR